MNNPSITYVPNSDATLETELSTVSNVYRFILDSAKKRGRLPDKGDPEDARKDQDAGTKTRIPQ